MVIGIEKMDRDLKYVSEVESKGVGQLTCFREREGKEESKKKKERSFWLGSFLIPFTELRNIEHRAS